jgi:hypothetical protein
LYPHEYLGLLSAFHGELIHRRINHLSDLLGIRRRTSFCQALPGLVSGKPTRIAAAFLRIFSAVNFQQKSCYANFSCKGIVSHCAFGIEIMAEVALFNPALNARFLPGLA